MSGSGPTLFIFNLKQNVKKELLNRFDNIILLKTRIKKRYHN